MPRSRVIRCSNGHVFRWGLHDIVGWCSECGSDRLTWIRARDRKRTLTPWQHAMLKASA